MATRTPLDTHSLTDLVRSSSDAPSTTSAVRLPSADTLVKLLVGRARHEAHTTRLGDSIYVSVNPQEPTRDASRASQQEYEDRAYKLRDGQGGDIVQPHAYELACRAYLMMKRTNETQSVVFSGLSGSGTTFQRQLFTAQVLRLSASTKKEARLAQQITALDTVLASFGSAKSALHSSASRHATFLELHFTSLGKLAGAKVLAFGLDKTRVTKLKKDERSYHVFYQLLAGASQAERDHAALLSDMTDYALFRSSGCYALPHGQGSDDAIAFEDLRAALDVLGFKPKHVSSIFTLLSAVLLLGNLEFTEPFESGKEASTRADSAIVVNRDILARIAVLLGLDAADLERGLTNRVRWIRKETTASVLDAAGAAQQRDSLMAALYSIVFAFVVETANHKLFPGDDAITALQASGGASILQLDIPGFHSTSTDRPGSGVLIRAQNGFEDFSANFMNDVLSAWMAEIEFDGDSGLAARAQEDGVRLSDVIPPSGLARLELLRGGRVGGKADRKPGGLLGGMAKTCQSVRKGAPPEEADENLVSGMREHYASHTAFIALPSGPGGKHAFGIQHAAGQVVYDTRGLIEHNLDALDPEFVALFRTSEDGFVGRLFSGPSLAAEVHPLDETIIVSAQVSNHPLRRPSPVVSPDSVPLSEIDFTAPLIDPLEISPLSTQLNAALSLLLNLLERTKLWYSLSLRPNDTFHSGQYDPVRLRAQISAYLVPELVARKQIDFVQDVVYETFCARHGLSDSTPEAVHSFLSSDQFGHLVQPTDFALGTSRVWLSYRAFRAVEDRLRASEPSEQAALPRSTSDVAPSTPPLQTGEFALPLPSASTATFNPAGDWTDLGGTPERGGGAIDSVDDLLLSPGGGANNSPYRQTGGFRQQQQQQYHGFEPPRAPYMHSDFGGPASGGGGGGNASDVWGSEKDVAAGFGGPHMHSARHGGRTEAIIDSTGAVKEDGKGALVEEVPTSRGRRIWVAIVWSLTWWVPSVTLRYLGRMKRPDVRLAWREKLALCMLIGLLCGTVVFYIVIFGRLICPNMNKAWNEKEVSYHAASNDYWVSVRGVVYDLTSYYKYQHSDIPGQSVDPDDMLTLGGQDLTDYFPIPLTTACPTLVADATLSLQYLNFTVEVATAIHTSGSQQGYSGSALHNANWYFETFLPKMDNFKKGPKVWSKKQVQTQAESLDRLWAFYEGGVYDLTDYFNTITIYSTNPGYQFLNADLAQLWQGQAGSDITQSVKDLNLDADTLATNMDCITKLFYQGENDFRLTPRCQVQPNLLLAFSMIIVATILAKFLAALQLGSKKTPELRDKFVICQVPCYTEGEESLKKTIDSLATLNYDDKRKLLFIICDGMIIGSGNDRPTPRIVLDILGVDQNNDPEALMFKSISEGSKQLNYGKVWSGLYEVEGHVVPYLVVAKILAMRFLNRVHFDSEMYPLELEMFHHVKNVIGVDPQLYEYMLVIDADTSVEPDSLNRLVSCTADDSRIIGICGETRLANEQDSWTTMIQVYEYFISHHMAKAFESLFGTVTCLPGCFTMYRLRSVDKGKPLLISSLIIDEYSECNLDTLHKKNLLALGEDRYLTTLILKHFPHFKTKFTPDAHASTVAPDSWSVLLSQRRRWINSTVHNLAELMFLPNMCGFCCFGMRFIVIIDLVGTLILPATFVYLVYLIVTVATGKGAVPVISLALIAAVYGLQAIIFLLKRQWQLIGWLVFYLLAYPIYSFVLPVYSFWCFDDFSWGNTRVVVGEGKSKKVLSTEDEAFDEASIPKKKFADYQAALELDDQDDARSAYSGVSKRTQSTAGFSLATKFPPGSYLGGQDYYRDTSHTRGASRSTFNQMPTQPTMSQMPSYNYGGAGPGSVYAPSEFAPPPASFSMGSMQQPSMPERRQSNMSAFTGYGGAPYGSLYSLNPFMTPSPMAISQSSNPTEEELLNALRGYLASRDLMTVTKKTARLGVQALFPNADLAAKRDFLNTSIDQLLAGGV